MRFVELVETSRAVTESSGRLAKISHLADLLERSTGDETAIAVSFLSGKLRQGKIGLGPAAIRRAWPEECAEEPTLTLREVDARFGKIAAASGSGSTKERTHLLRDLLLRATEPEQHFLASLVFGELRQGALEGLMTEAIARAAKVPIAAVRRATMSQGDPAVIAAVALAEGEIGLRKFAIELFRPVRPMLATPVEDPAEAIARLGEAALEFKLDGARIQAHKSGSEVRVFSRQLNDVTLAVPEIVEIVRALAPKELILDGEAIALRADGSPLPFQVTMRRFGRRLDVEKLREQLPVTPFFFDALRFDGADLIDETWTRRTEVLDELLSPAFRVPRTTSSDASGVSAFLQEALQRGHEGIMAKSLHAGYEAGGRGFSWLKIKASHTLDLVVLAAEWGHGRRRGWLSNLHLGARDPNQGGFAMLGKTFKGLTDELLASQTKRLLELEIARDEHTVHVRPELVVEIAFSDVQSSPHYPSGLALRFARVKRYRPDKTAADADTIATVREIHRRAAEGR